MRVLAVIPAHNEEACLPSTIDGLRNACPDVDFLVVNDGSTDETEAICERLDLTHLTLPINTGLTSGFRAGMKYALRHGYDAVVQFDADGQHLPEYIPRMAQTMVDEGADIVIASRYLDGTKPTGARGMGSRLISLLIKATTHCLVTDPTSGMRMYNRDMIRHFARDFDISPEPDTVALMARRGKRIVEIPARMRERQGGESYFDLPHIVDYMARTCASIVLFQWLR